MWMCSPECRLKKMILEYEPTMLFVEHDARFREKIAMRKVKLI